MRAKTYKEIKNEKQKLENEKFKKQYFEYYDDIKSSTHKKYDW